MCFSDNKNLNHVGSPVPEKKIFC